MTIVCFQLDMSSNAVRFAETNKKHTWANVVSHGCDPVGFRRHCREEARSVRNSNMISL